MAKMALNGYEIGIQRKIKPADHIQSMADKIQDTIVTKHPLNTENISSEENSRENTLRRPLHKNFDKGYGTAESIQNIGDKIKNTIMSNHPAIANNIYNSTTPPPPPLPTSNNTYNNTTPPPPPLPTSPIPTFNVHSTPVAPSPLVMNTMKKPADFIPKNLISSFGPDVHSTTNTNGKSHNGSGYSSSSDDSNKEKFENNTNTLRKTNGEKSFSNGKNNLSYDSDNTNFSNTLSKRNIFEKIEATSGLNNSIDSMHKKGDKRNNGVSNLNTLKKPSVFEKFATLENGKNNFKNDEINNKPIMFEKSTALNNGKNHTKENVEVNKKPSLLSNLYDNSLYTYKTNGTNGINDVKRINGNESVFNDRTIEKDIHNESENHEEDNETETVVRRRQKKTEKIDDGRRDSHIVARPLSTMTAVDVTDGHYPVCHKCEKAITRGPFITALGRIWCPEHFICTNATCRRPLQDIGFVEENGQLYCEYCFEQYIAPACDKCHAKIKGDCLNAIGKHFHPECFNCVYCGKLFGNNPFFLEDGLPYCEADWNELFTTKCFACGFPVEAGDRWVEALNNNYHSQCFNCTVCKKNLEGQSFFAKGGRPFCKSHAR
ncbi:hypothetical protein O0L34_g17564 [Tuta absoluta]|nr:hypothetical protein O0L34_g17564 [Tuta absoluta]